MSDRIQGLATERAGWPPRFHQRLRGSHERPRGIGIEADAQQVRAILVIVRGLDVVAVLGGPLCLDDHCLVGGIPGQGHGAHAEHLDDGLLEIPARHLASTGARSFDGLQQIVESGGKRRDLDLLDAEADHRLALSRLEVELSLARRADGSGQKPVRIVEDEQASCHGRPCYPLAPASMTGADEHRGSPSESGPMRQRFGLSRPRSMARRTGREARFDLSPRARLIGGWLAAVLLVLVIAGAVRLFGGNADGNAVLATPTPAASAGVHSITFGTELGADRVVPASAATDRFVREDLFAYSVAEAPPAMQVYVAVRRVAGGPAEVVQAATEAQVIPDGPATIGFRVAAENLFVAFGAGSYEMTIALEANGSPIASGTFELIDASAPGESSGG